MTGPSRARTALPAAIAVALVVSAALLLLGVILETTTAGAAPATSGTAAGGHNEATERGGEQGEAPHSQAPLPLPPTTVAAPAPTVTAAAPTPAAEQPGEVGHSDTAGTADADNGQGETVLGIPIESPVPDGAFVVVSLVLAALVWRRPTRLVATVVILVAAAAVVLDIAEVIHQLGASRTGLGVLAVVVGALHLAVIAAAGWLRTTTGTGSRRDALAHSG